MRHAKRRKLTVEDFNKALRWSNVEVGLVPFLSPERGSSQFPVTWAGCSCPLHVFQAISGYGAQDALPFRSVKEGELFFVEDRDINLIELALATNIPKGCAETMVRGGSTHTCLHLCSSEQHPKWDQSLSTDCVSCFLSVNVAYLDGKGNIEPQGTGKPRPHFEGSDEKWSLASAAFRTVMMCSSWVCTAGSNTSSFVDFF